MDVRRNKSAFAFFILSCFFLSCHSKPPSEISDAFKSPVISATATGSTLKIQWQDWSDEVFQKAAKDHRLLILDLEAVWCHWCHVMEETTYADPKIIDFIQKNYIPIRVDQDARPDLAMRYQYYGWPATIVFNSKGEEIRKERGYMSPEEMIAMLTEAVKNPKPKKEVIKLSKPPSENIGDELRKNLLQEFESEYDSSKGGWGGGHRYLNQECLEFAIRNSQNPAYVKMFKQTLDSMQKIIDPEWGGMYQYSTDSDWDHPHFEKIMFIQAEGLKTYIEAYAFLKNPEYKKSADLIYQYLKNFLRSPDGVFYTSQDADIVQGEHAGEYFKLSSANRKKQGIPRVDQHIYARENGWAIKAFATYYEVTGDKSKLQEAIRATNWILKNRSLSGGGFRHDERDPQGEYLGDSLSMGDALLSIYASTGDRSWLDLSKKSADFAIQNFQNEDQNIGGMITSRKKSIGYRPTPDRDENVMWMRFANLLFHYTGDEKYKTSAKQTMRFLAIPEIARQRFTANVLLADSEISADPLHLTVVGSKKDERSQKLFESALRYPSFYKRVEWKDPQEGPLPNPDVDYPVMDQPAAYICTSKTCSAPVFSPKEFLERIELITAK